MDDKTLNDYDIQLEKYIKETLKIKNYKINYQEEGAILHQLIQRKTKLILDLLEA